MKSETLIRFIDKTKRHKRHTNVVQDKKDNDIVRDVTVGKTVIHDHFGEGQITDISEDIVSVDFDNSIRRFPYPDSFLEMYLVIKQEE